MRNWKLLPKIENIAKYIECCWFLEKESHDQGCNYPKLNPDPSAHLIIADLNSTHEYTNSSTFYKLIGNHWIYPHLKTFLIDHSAPIKVLEIQF